MNTKTWYRVTVTRSECQSVLVKAASDEEAEALAIEKAERCDDAWEEDGMGCEVAGFYEVSDEEAKECAPEDDDEEDV